MTTTQIEFTDTEPLALEDIARSRDRLRVHLARGGSRRWLVFWLLVGPGILAMLGENDGPSMIAYAADGAQYGLGFFVPFTVLMFGLAYACQEMCMRVGAVTHRGYGELVLQRYGPVWGWFGAVDLSLTNLVTLVAEFVSIRVGLAYFHLGAGVAVALGSGWWCSASAAGGTGGGSASRWAWPCSTACSWWPRFWSGRTRGRWLARWPSCRFPAEASTHCCC